MRLELCARSTTNTVMAGCICLFAWGNSEQRNQMCHPIQKPILSNKNNKKIFAWLFSQKSCKNGSRIFPIFIYSSPSGNVIFLFTSVVSFSSIPLNGKRKICLANLVFHLLLLQSQVGILACLDSLYVACFIQFGSAQISSVQQNCLEWEFY